MRRLAAHRSTFALALAILAVAGMGCRSTRFACPTVGPALPVAAAPDCPAPRDYPFRNLVFEGGGIKGLAYGGALQVLEEQRILPQIERVAGTSAGAITAMLVALRYPPSEIRKLLFDLDFKQLEDGKLAIGLAHAKSFTPVAHANSTQRWSLSQIDKKQNF